MTWIALTGISPRRYGGAVPIQVLVLAPPEEHEVIGRAIQTREGFALAHAADSAAAVEQLVARPAAAIVIRPGYSGPPPAELLQQLRALPSAHEARIVAVLDETADAQRPVWLRNGADDIAWVPGDESRIGDKVAAIDESEFRRTPRVPCSGNAIVMIGTRAVTARLDSVSVMSVRIHWSEEIAGRPIVPIALEFTGMPAHTVWCRIEDLARSRGKPVGLVLRFVALTPEERAALAHVVEKHRMSRERAGPLENVGVPAKFDAPPPKEERTRYEMVLPEAPAPARRRRWILGIAVAVFLVTAAVAGWQLSRLLRPSGPYVDKPVLVVEGLRLKHAFAMGSTFATVADASWEDLDLEGRRTAVASLVDEARKRNLRLVEVYTPRGFVASASVSSSGAPTIELHEE